MSRRIPLFLSCLLVVLALTFASCGAPDEGPLAVRVMWGLNDPAASIPDGVERLRILVDIEGEDMIQESIHTVEGLEDADGNGRPELDRDALTPGVPIFMTIEGQDGAGRTLYVGHAGPFILQHGERRHIDLRMYELGEATVLDGAPLTPRFLHTATSLPDGRVLVAGGFDGLTSTPCPVGTVDPDARCFGLVATDSAGLFDATTGRVTATRTSMLSERAGHTATLLADGRVLLAGGCETATLVFEHQAGGFSFALVPGAGGDAFEIFDPNAGAEVEDIDRDGDPGRGAFVGAADEPDEPGRLDTDRVMHGAALLPDGRVLLAGGVTSADTYTVFDPQRAGGYGVVDIEALGSEHAYAGVGATGTGATTQGWILGGSDALTNDDLAEIWTPGAATAPIGSVAPATDEGFPDAAMTARPELALWRPLVTTVGAGRYLLAVGWLGPRCGTDGMPTFDPAAALCGYSATSLRSYTLDSTTGIAVPTMVRNAHSLGALAVLDSGQVVVTGGVIGLGFAAGNTIDVFTGAVAGGTATLSDLRPLLSRARALHTSAALPDGGLMSFGGIAPAADLASIQLVTGLEVQYIR